MTDDDVKAAVEALRGAAGGSLDRRVVDTLLNHIDGEAARLAAAKTEAAEQAWDEAVKATELEQAHVRLRAVAAAREEQGDEVRALRVRVAELERSEKTLDAVCWVLGREVGNRGDSEGAGDVTERIIHERDEAVAALRGLLRDEWYTYEGNLEASGRASVDDLNAARAVLAKYPEGR